MGKGGGGGGAPQNSTTQTSNIPSYARPYVESMLGATQRQLFEGEEGEKGAFKITGFKPYQAYSSNPQDYFAGPSSLQQGVYNEAGQMQTPGGFGAAQGLSGLSAMGQLGAGRQYQQMATDPFAIQGYMSPYMQNVVDTQKTGALRDFQIGQTARQGQQTLRGAFGGSRTAIENAEAQRALNSQLQGIQATGTQKAYEDAQRAQQFGANLNLQGLQGAGQMAGQIGQLAGAQQQADLARMGFQQQTGKAQQDYQQNIINQQIQDYATAQQYPYMQLGMMSNMLRGLPMQSMTTQSYQAQPNIGSQVAGLAATGLGAYGAAGGFRGYKEGGTVDSYAEGGGVVGGVEAQLMQMDIPQLMEVAKTSPSVSIRQKAAEIIAEKQMAAQTKQSMGLESAPAGNLDDLGMAGGGIVAFNGEGGSYVDPDEPRQRRQTEMWERVRPDNKPYLAEDFREDAARFLNPIKDFLTMRGPRDLEKAKQLQTADQPGDYEMYTPKSVDYTTATNTSAPASNVQARTNAPAAPASNAPANTRSGLEATLADYNKFREAVYGKEDPEGAKRAALAQIEAQRADLKEQREQDFYRAIMMGGLGAAAGKSQNFISNIAEGAQKGLTDYAGSLKNQRADKKLLLEQQVEVEKAEEARKAGRLKDLMAHADRIEQIKERRAVLANTQNTRSDEQASRYVQQVKKDVFAQVLAEKKLDPMNLQENPALMAGVEAEVTRRLNADPLYNKKLKQLLGDGYTAPTGGALPPGVTVKKLS